jgi:hypothetical protein
MFSSPRPPKFGSKLDFERAVLEAKWIDDNDNDNIAQIANKYNFPPEFIKAGIFGLKEKDYLLKTSKWWPIIAQWDEQEEEARYRVQRAAAYEAKASRDLIIYLLLAISVLIELLYFAAYNLVIPGITVIIGLFLPLYRRSEDWNLKLEDEIHKSEIEGYKNVAQDFIQLTKENALFAFYAFKRFSKERPQRIVSKPMYLELDDKGNPIPVFEMIEDPDEEYARRVQEIESKNKASQSA